MDQGKGPVQLGDLMLAKALLQYVSRITANEPDVNVRRLLRSPETQEQLVFNFLALQYQELQEELENDSHSLRAVACDL